MLMQEFTRMDWSGWCGAERWPESEPYIAYPSDVSAVIADHQGVSIHWFKPDGELLAVQRLGEPNRDAAITAGNFVSRAIESNNYGSKFAVILASLGFETTLW